MSGHSAPVERFEPRPGDNIVVCLNKHPERLVAEFRGRVGDQFLVNIPAFGDVHGDSVRLDAQEVLGPDVPEDATIVRTEDQARKLGLLGSGK